MSNDRPSSVLWSIRARRQLRRSLYEPTACGSAAAGNGLLHRLVAAWELLGERDRGPFTNPEEVFRKGPG
jgi:hypothetical protein